LELTKKALKSEKKERLSIIATLIKAEDGRQKEIARSRALPAALRPRRAQ